MKQISMVLLFILLITMASCGGDGDNGEPVKPAGIGDPVYEYIPADNIIIDKYVSGTGSAFQVGTGAAADKVTSPNALYVVDGAEFDGKVHLDGGVGTISGVVPFTGSPSFAWVDINDGTIDGAVIGGDSSGSATFSQVTVSGTLTAKTGRTATVVVAASNASAWSKSQADYVCDAVDDHAQILAVIADGVEDIYLTQGDYYGEDIDLGNYSVNIHGAGVFATYYHLENSTDDYAFKATSANYHSSIKNLSIVCNSAGNASGGGINATNIMAAQLENLRISDANDYGVYANGSTEYVTCRNVITYDCYEGWQLTNIQWWDFYSCNVTKITHEAGYGITLTGNHLLLDSFTADMYTTTVNVTAGIMLYNCDDITLVHCFSFGTPTGMTLDRGYWSYSDSGTSSSVRFYGCRAKDIDTVSGAPAFQISNAGGASLLEGYVLDGCSHDGIGSVGFSAQGAATDIGCSIRNSKSTATSPFVVTNAGWTLHDNPGFVTVNSGTSTGTGAQQTIAHGCNVIPVQADITVTLLGVSGTPAVVSAAPSATNIYITAPNGINYAWRVDTEN